MSLYGSDLRKARIIDLLERMKEMTIGYGSVEEGYEV